MIESKPKAKNDNCGQLRLPAPFLFANPLRVLFICKVKKISVKGVQIHLKLSKMKQVANYQCFFASVSEKRSALCLIETLLFSQLRDFSFP